MYIGTNVLMYERWLVLKVRYTAGPTLSPFHRLTLLVHVSQKQAEQYKANRTTVQSKQNSRISKHNSIKQAEQQQAQNSS